MRITKKVSILLAVTVSLAFSDGCKRNPSPQPLLLSIAVDPESGVAPWLFSEVVDFNALSPTSNARKTIQVTTILKKDYADLLGMLSPTRRADLVVLGFDSETDYLKELTLDSESGVPLARVAMVVATSAEKAERATSMAQLLRLAQNGKIRLLQADPRQHSAGLAALALEAYGRGAVKSDGAGLNSAALAHMFGWLPGRISIFDLQAVNGLGKDDVAIISEDQCVSLREKANIEAFYPTDGTMEIDYRAYVTRGTSGERKDAVQQFLNFLKLRKADEARARYAIDKKCTDSLPRRILPVPSATTLHRLQDSWSRAAR
jgi:hypothetical protein